MAKLASTCTIWVLIVRVNFPGECSRLFVLSFLMTLLLGSERGGSEWTWETNTFKKHPRYFWCFPPLSHSQPLVTGAKNNPEAFHSIFSAMRASVRNCLCNNYDETLVRYFLLISSFYDSTVPQNCDIGNVPHLGSLICHHQPHVPTEPIKCD